jgi:tetratricopeptide (TPR) repeat protein
MRRKDQEGEDQSQQTIPNKANRRIHSPHIVATTHFTMVRPVVGLWLLFVWCSPSWSSFIDSQSFIIRSRQKYGQYLLLAIQAINNQEMDLAHQYLDRVIERYPDHSDALYNKGVACHRSGDALGAIFFYTEALRSNPGDVRIRLNLAAINQLRNNLTEAIEHYQFV